ncbi:MAG: cheB, glutamate methylesterase, partial [Pseudomonadota bacterium]
MEKVILYPGQTLVTQDAVEIHSIVSSCIEVVLHDPVRRITGVSIFVQPRPDGEHLIQSARYGCYSLDHVLEKMLILGADPQRMLARVYGGGTLNDSLSRTSTIGKKNIDFALAWLRHARIPVVSSELGGLRARSVFVNSIHFSVRQNRHENSSELESAYGQFSSLKKKSRVVVVENSPTTRVKLTRVLQQHDLVDVVGVAVDAFEAREMLVEHQPDLVLISSELPKISGIELLERLMKYFPLPVIMITGALAHPKVIAEALEFGAVDCIESPESIADAELDEYGDYLRSKVLSASRIADRVHRSFWNQFSPSKSAADKFNSVLSGMDVLLFGGDTGAHFELESLLSSLPKDGPAVLLALDRLPLNYLKRLVEKADLKLVEGGHLQTLSPGCTYFPPEGYCFELLSDEGVKKIGLVEA